MSAEANAALTACVETIESSYEFMLAYAAQGRDGESGTGGGGPAIRDFLMDLSAALVEIGGIADAVASGLHGDRAAAFRPFIDTLREDAARSKSIVDAVLAVPSIGSQLIDNLNASIHLRALLTDIFVLDEALKGFR